MNIAVIGAGYGDEGKGLLVDALYRRYDMKVVTRFSGGSQAGHTVVTPDGRRREFHGLCAATYAGAVTNFAPKFIVNPYKLSEEIAELVDEGFTPKVEIDSGCMVTTIYDMAINAIVETSRGVNRHGSCGLGINETIRRTVDSENSVQHDSSIRFYDSLDNEEYVGYLFSNIKTQWVPERLKVLGVDWASVVSPYREILLEDHSIHCKKFLDALKYLDSYCVKKDRLPSLVGGYKHFIFEGSQGLLLDQRYGFFPYVTPGLVGCADIPSKVQNCVYVTRAYASRHGAGPLPYENTAMKFFDETNVKNEWQGEIRFAPLDVDRMRVAIQADKFATSRGNTWPNCFLAVTHIDQMYDTVPVVHHCQLKEIPKYKFSRWLSETLGLELLCESWGPCSTDINWFAEPRGVTRRVESCEASR